LGDVLHSLALPPLPILEPGRDVHELSFAESTLELALRHARQAGAQRVVALHLVLGEFTAVEPASLEFYWERITKDTPADGSRVSVRRVPAQLACGDCASACDPRDETWVCPVCGSSRLRMTSGDECYLESIDVEGVGPSSPGCEARSSPAGCPSGVPSSGCPSGVLRSDEARSSTGC
jgi:hydrogenase nickel incorporation protein HypA/HybF